MSILLSFFLSSCVLRYYNALGRAGKIIFSPAPLGGLPTAKPWKPTKPTESKRKPLYLPLRAWVATSADRPQRAGGWWSNASQHKRL